MTTPTIRSVPGRRLSPLFRQSVLQRIVPICPHQSYPLYRYASASTSKPRVLEKPAGFNPPSHGRRLKQNIPRNYGPELTQEQQAEQEKKHYPNMMPPEGTFLHWFLTNTWIHVWISLGTLTLLASFTMWENWKRSTTFKNGLPTRDQVLLHPLDSFYQFMFAWRASADEQSMASFTKNQRGVDDAQKRASYRKAHGGDPDDQGVEYWPPFEKRYGHCVIDEKTGRLVDARTLPNNGVKPQPKKWFGIW